MDRAIQIIQDVGVGAGMVALMVLCLVALALSCFSISGTWVVSVCALAMEFLAPESYPGWSTLITFIAVSAAVEGMEALAGTWGVRKRGGSGWAGFAALAGGILGLIWGTAIPVPLLGSLLGMMAGSFGCVYLVERYRLKHSGQAAHIAWGSVTARVLMIMIKVLTTLLMTVWLFAALWIFRG